MKKSILKKTTAYLLSIILIGFSASFNAFAKSPEGCCFNSQRCNGIYKRPLLHTNTYNDLSSITRRDYNLDEQIYIKDGFFKKIQKIPLSNINTENLVDGKEIDEIRGTSLQLIFTQYLKVLCDVLLKCHNIESCDHLLAYSFSDSIDTAMDVLYIKKGQDVTGRECVKEFFLVLEGVAKQLATRCPYFLKAISRWNRMVVREKERLGLND